MQTGASIRARASEAEENRRSERARRLGRRQVLIGPFPPILHRKIRKYVKYSRIFLFCLDEKSLAQNCFARKKIDFCVGQGEKRRNTGYVFRAFSTKSGAKRSFLRWTYPYSARPKGRPRLRAEQVRTESAKTESESTGRESSRPVLSVSFPLSSPRAADRSCGSSCRV